MAVREGPAGWGSVAGLAVIAATLSAVNPAILLVVPFALLALALPPRRPLVLGVAARRQGDLFGVVAFSDRVDAFLRAMKM